MKFQELKLSLKNSIKPIYLVFGEDLFLKNTSVSLIDNAVTGGNDINKVVVTTEEIDGKTLVDLCNTYGFFGKKLVVLKEVDGKKSNDLLNKIKEYQKQPNMDTVLVVVMNEGSEFFAPLKYTTETVDCSRLNDDLLTKWILNKINGKLKINSIALKQLIDYCNHYLSRIDLELDKLISFCENEITSLDVENLVQKDLEYNIFEFTENICKGNKQKALQIFEDLINDKKNYNMVLPLIENHFRRLFYVSVTKLPIEELASHLGIKEFAVKKIFEQTHRFSPITLKNILQKCEEIDAQIKTGMLQYVSATTNLVNYILLNIK